MKTRERIILKALELFNTEGLQEVSQRKIAKSLGISQGNLNYHFKTKEEIVHELYFRLVGRLNSEMEKISQEQPILSFLSQSSLISMNIMFEFRFITRDLYKVLDSDQSLKNHYLELQKLRKEQYLLLFQNMIKEGLLREEELKGEYSRLYERMNILGDNWINASFFFNNKHVSEVEYYHAVLFEIIYPYLTRKGKNQYLALV